MRSEISNEDRNVLEGETKRDKEQEKTVNIPTVSNLNFGMRLGPSRVEF